LYYSEAMSKSGSLRHVTRFHQKNHAEAMRALCLVIFLNRMRAVWL